MPKVTPACFSHVGMKRTQNQDSFLSVPEIGLFVVADGMGGHRGGEVASQLAVKSIAEYFEKNSPKDDPQDHLKRAILSANHSIQAKSQEDSALLGMGTTTTALLFSGNQLFIGHVGDSRCYLIQNSESGYRIWQLTQDHSLVQEKLKAGIINRDQLKTDKMKHVLTRSVGVEAEVEIDLYTFKVQPGDAFVTCSDGLSGMLPDAEIRDIVANILFKNKITDRVAQASQSLIEAANKRGGEDNVTALVVQVE